jgi:battenin
VYIALEGIPVSVQIPLMLWVGLMGGASYVNVMFMILSSGRVGFEYKELVMNVSLMHNNLGIIMAALLAMAVDNFWLK